MTTRPPPVLAAILAICICMVWVAMSQYVYWLLLRELYRAGEAVGITPTGPGAPLRGQTLGFNWHEPAPWWNFAARALAAAGALAPGLAPALWARRRTASGRRIVPSASRFVHARVPIAMLTAGVVFSNLDRSLAHRLTMLFIDVGERLGGTIYHEGGIVVGQNGPFMGGTTIDAIGNHLYGRGAHEVIAAAACVAAIFVHCLLWRGDLRAAAAGRLCVKCAYDLRGTPIASPCPECGHSQPG